MCKVIENPCRRYVGNSHIVNGIDFGVIYLVDSEGYFYDDRGFKKHVDEYGPYLLKVD